MTCSISRFQDAEFFQLRLKSS